ncbi:hypothetical protein OHV13_11525 [Kitasatospora purpeofusca]|uniref:hypothetical protein n=1 Tax=Kitasatospora purpeofusca TaxID=67352 RepID=UPI003253AA63
MRGQHSWKAHSSPQAKGADVIGGSPTCPCGNPVELTGAETDDIPEWRCVCGRFGFLLPPDYVTRHPDEPSVQVCGRKAKPRPREVPMEVVPAVGYELEIEGALTVPFVSADDIDKHFETAIADSVRRNLFIADDAPLVLLVTDEFEVLQRIEQAAAPPE